MGIGLGIVLLLAGLILAFDVVSIPPIEQYVATETLGWILIVVGALAIVLALVTSRQRGGGTRTIEERRYDR